MKSNINTLRPSEQASHASSGRQACETRELLKQMEFMEYGDILRSQNQAAPTDAPMQITSLQSASAKSASKQQKGHPEASTRRSEESEKLDMLPMLKENQQSRYVLNQKRGSIA